MIPNIVSGKVTRRIDERPRKSRTGKIITRTVIGGAAFFVAMGTIGAIAGPAENAPEKTVVRYVERDKPSTTKPDARDERHNSPRQQGSTTRNDKPVEQPAPRSEPVAPQNNQGGNTATQQHESSPKDDSAKITTEDGTKVDPQFYNRTDYNANGVTDQEEPGWNNGAGEQAFKDEGTAKYRQWCDAHPGECR